MFRSKKEDAVFFAALVPLLGMVVYSLCHCLSWGTLVVMRSLARQLAQVIRSRRSSTVSDVERVVREKMQQQKVSNICSSLQVCSFVLLPLTFGLQIIIADGRRERRATLTQDVIHLLLHTLMTLTCFFPRIVSTRTSDPIYIVMSLAFTLYIAPFSCHAEFMLEALLIANVAMITLTAVAPSVLLCCLGNAIFVVSVCSLVWTNRVGNSRPGALMSIQVVLMGFITGCKHVMDRSMESTIRQGMELQTAKELLSAASALLRSCCDIVVELDSHGNIVGPATDLASFLLRGPGSKLEGTPLIDLMVAEEDRLFFADMLQEEQTSERGLADARNVRMRDGNDDVLLLELLWFQFRHFDQQLRYMVGLKEFSNQNVTRTPFLPEGMATANTARELPATVVIDSTQDDHPVTECSDEFCKRIGRIVPGESLSARLKNSRRFAKWLQKAAHAEAYGHEAPPDCDLIFQMLQGEMTATCSIAHSESNTEGAGDALDLRHIRLNMIHIRRRCSTNSSSDRGNFKGTPVTRLGL
mmetsp:Transcript_47613/g.146706  ORF Transcript_47613/g.146706 Transcript_47613/m.146706 type:complete len:527 (-) Transcript_47613:67-1647(-)